MKPNAIVSREEWLAARKRHLSKEKEFTRLRDELSHERRELPCPRGAMRRSSVPRWSGCAITTGTGIDLCPFVESTRKRERRFL